MSILLKLFCVLIVCGCVRIAAARFGNRLAACLLGFPTMTSLLTAVNLDGLRSAGIQNLARAGIVGLLAATVLATTLALVSLRSRSVLAPWAISLVAYSLVVAATHWTDLLPFWLQTIVAAVLLVICGIVLYSYPLAEAEIPCQRRSTISFRTLMLPTILVVTGEFVQRIGWPMLLALVATFPTMTCSQLAFSRATNGPGGPLALVRRLPFTNLSTLAFWFTLQFSVSSISIESAFVLSLVAAAISLTGVVRAIDWFSRAHRTRDREEMSGSQSQQKFEESVAIQKNVCPVGLPMLASDGVTIQIDDQWSHQHVLVN